MLTDKQKKSVLVKLEKLENKLCDNVSRFVELLVPLNAHLGGFTAGLTSKKENVKSMHILAKANKLVTDIDQNLLDIEDILVIDYKHFLGENQKEKT